ncbi:hypothetical protein PBY51_015927 [Eleginops maclovinus]|uniref:Uncharacterized protein n=1 Tax=Eleginops maclovinus TaxID=56733 RepID=A0AAN7XJR2_ELEMC|nr:hypothetical protein PBY51_015927 [Eleginops maclovinus]
MSGVVSAVMNALVVCWREEHLIGLLYRLRSQVVPPAGSRGSPMLFDRSSPKRSFRHWSVRVDGLLCGRFDVCIHSNPSVLQLRTIGADLPLNPSSLPP